MLSNVSLASSNRLFCTSAVIKELYDTVSLTAIRLKICLTKPMFLHLAYIVISALHT
uniref:Uncharacterized protein n=1 Tax=Arundo donax TaxID=35708 RepID=A0A0A9HK71_ARUDO